MHKPGSLEKYNNKVSFATYMPTIINVKLVSIYIWEVGGHGSGLKPVALRLLYNYNSKYSRAVRS